MSVITQVFHNGKQSITNKIRRLLDNIINKYKLCNQLNSCLISGIKYKPYTTGNLPPTFGFKQRVTGDGDVQEGIYQWFNYKGFTYVTD